MRNLKKFLALVLALMMAFSLMVTVNAANADPMSDLEDVTEELQEAVTVLNGMGIITGFENGEFRPQDPIRRVDVSALVYRLVTGDWQDSRSNLYSTYQKFSDVTSTYSWAAGYIGYCANQEIIKGVGGNRYAPESNVTGYQILAMVLRAVGYDQNGEFEGTDWQVRVASTATQLGILDNINTTSYAGTLGDPATRELVAEIIFQAAQLPMVRYELGYYNPYIGVAIANGNNVLNDSLGYKYYGLKDASDIILGNQATGETGTVLGVSKTPYVESGVTYYANTSYMFAGTEIGTSGDDSTGTALSPANTSKITVAEGLRLAETTGLDLFGHKVKAWYNAKDASTNKQTYAIIDEASLTATVYSPDSTNGEKLSASSKTDALLGIEAQKAGFTVNLDSTTGTNNKAHESLQYARIATTPVAAVSTASPNGIYALVSNNKDKTVDVIIALNGEVDQITQKNTALVDPTLTLAGAGTAATTPPQALSTSSAFGASNDGVIKEKSIVEGSETTLGAKVAAWKVAGTNCATTYTGDATHGNKGTNTNMPYYQLDSLTRTVTGTVRTYDNTAKLTLSNGEEIERSWLWSRVVKGAIQSPLNASGAVTFEADVEYTIYLDNDGRWLGASEGGMKFVYGTFADYETGALGSGTIGYAITGVNGENGEKIFNHPVNSMLISSTSYPNSTGPKTLADGYDALTVSKKNLGNGSAGNEITSGAYTGYMVDEEGFLNADDLGGWTNISSTTWTIDSDDVANGFADVKSDGSVLCTEDTTFYVVSGTGSATLKVETYNGIKDFLQGYSSVKLDTTGTKPNNAYYITKADRYNKWDTTNNNIADIVIMGADELTYTGAKNLFFAAPSATATGVLLAGTDASHVKQYVLYNDGVKGTYFVDDSISGGAAATGASSTGTFYELTQDRTVNGTPVYKAVALTTTTGLATTKPAESNTFCALDQAYTYVSVSNNLTARIGGVTMNVSNAKVVDLNYDPITSNYKEITSVDDLNYAISGGSLTIKVAVVYDGVNVSMIYVTAVTP